MAAEPVGVADLFDRVAETYDAVGVEWFRPIARGLVRELEPAPGERVLDVGCGRGAALFPLADAVGTTGQVLGIDLAPGMIAATAAQAQDLPQVSLAVADATAPGLPPASYDVVASSLVLFFLTNPVAALAAWRELLVPGGRVGVTTFGRQDPRWSAVDRLFAPYLPPAMLDARTSGQRGPFGSDEGVAGLLAAAGFVDVRTVTSSVTAVFSGPEQWLEFSWSHGQRQMWEAVPPQDREQLRLDAFAVLDSFREADGPIRLDQEVRYTLGRRPLG